MRKTTLFFHPFVTSQKISRITFAFEPVFSEDNKLISVLGSFALCSKSDQFCRETGRKTALTKVPTALKVRDIPKFVADTINKYSAARADYTPSEFYFLCLSFVE